MRSFSFGAFSLFTAQLVLLLCRTEASRGPHNLQRETPNSFKPGLGHWSTLDVRGETVIAFMERTSQARNKSRENIFDVYDKAIAIMDIDRDEILDCLWARRKDYDATAKSVTYVWSLAAPNGSERKYVSFHFTEGDTPDTVKFNVSADGDAHTGIAKFLYTDYKNCAIFEVPQFGDQCTLWGTEDVQDSVPQHCLEQFADTCGNGVSLHDADKCRGVEI